MNLVQFLLVNMLLIFSPMNDVPYPSLQKGFETSDAESISNLGKDKMLINILGKEGAYSQPQANLVLKDFFSKKPCSSFNFIFKGKESADGTFAIGTYESKGENFRITIHFKKADADFKIESLIIEKS
jgi:hypothetical protein